MNANTNLVQSRACIALFTSGAWRTVKRHPKETQAENARHGLKDEARVDVQICSHPALTRAAEIVNEARAEHYRLTLPCTDDGFRLLPGARQMEHAEAMAKHSAAFTQAVTTFCDAYDDVRLDAPRRLNGLYIASQWPDRETVRSKFRLQTRYLPVPALGQWDTWLQESAEVGRAELRERIGVAVKKVAAKLSDPQAIFRDSLIGNLREIIDLAPDLNLMDDPDIARLAQSARHLGAVDPDTLREDPVARATVAERASELCSIFNL